MTDTLHRAGEAPFGFRVPRPLEFPWAPFYGPTKQDDPELILAPRTFEGRSQLFAPAWHQLLSPLPIFADLGFSGCPYPLSVNPLGLHDSEEGSAVLTYEEKILVANPILLQ